MFSKFVCAWLVYVITYYSKDRVIVLHWTPCFSRLIVHERKLRLLSLKCDTRQNSSVDIQCLKKREHPWCLSQPHRLKIITRYPTALNMSEMWCLNRQYNCAKSVQSGCSVWTLTSGINMQCLNLSGTLTFECVYLLLWLQNRLPSLDRHTQAECIKKKIKTFCCWLFFLVTEGCINKHTIISGQSCPKMLH